MRRVSKPAAALTNSGCNCGPSGAEAYKRERAINRDSGSERRATKAPSICALGSSRLLPSATYAGVHAALAFTRRRPTPTTPPAFGARGRSARLTGILFNAGDALFGGRRPFHLLLQGGDQLYADTIWEEMPELGAWRRLPWREANAHPFTPGMAEEADRYYFEHYCWLWSQKDIAPLLATLPSVMMWDDHDIFDGWGSWPHDRQSCPVFAGLIGVARDYFALFQLGGLPGRLPDVCDDPDGRHFGSAYRVGSIGIVAPDLRSERTRERIMGEAGWRDFEAALKRLADCRHVILMSSVPLANTDMSLIERGFVAVPGHSDLEDDLRDQWQSFGHRDEWRRMLSTLVAFSARTGARVTSLSGEIHLGALGLIEGRGVQIHEMTSSGIVHEPPPKLVTAAYEWLGRRTTVLGPDLKACLLKIPGHGRRYLRARNWLSLDLGGDGGFVGIWNTEKGEGGRLAMAGQASCELRASPEREPSHA